MTSPREISPEEKDIAPGWPRPFYRKDDKVEYVQWITDRASMQITSCELDKTYAAGTNHLCTSCGEKMEKGLIFDREWINNTDKVRRDKRKFDDHQHINLGVYDSHYGGSICFRCAVFALKHCPMFSEFDERFGDDMQWHVTTDPDDTREGDDTSVLEVTKKLPKITTGQIREHVQKGELFFEKVDNLENLQSTKRPGIYFVRGNEDDE